MLISQSVLRGLMASLILAFPFPAQADYARCDTKMCYTHQEQSIQSRVQAGETVVLSETDPSSPYELTYVLKKVEGVDPQLIAGLFGSAEELPRHIEAITDAKVLSRNGNAVVVRYELDVSRLAGKVDLGALASKAPVSRYAVTTHLEKQDNGGYLIWWELEPDETARLNPRKGLFNMGNLGEPEYVHGYLFAEPLAGTHDSVVTYANYVVPKSGLARTMAGTMNHASKAVLSTIVESIGEWAKSVAGDAGAAKTYRDRCEALLTH